MDSELIRRYVYAVTKRLPRKSREDVAKELNTLIADMLEERCGQVLPTEKDVRVVLTELGTPAELYDQYSGEGEEMPDRAALLCHVSVCAENRNDMRPDRDDAGVCPLRDSRGKRELLVP